MRRAKPANSVSSIVITQAVAILGFVIVPGLVTFMVPRTTIQLQHRDGQATARIVRHTLLFVPLYTTRIDPLLDAESQVSAAKQIKEDRQRNRKASTQIADGSVLLFGQNQMSQVQSTYEDALVQAEQIKAFLQDPSAKPLTLLAHGPWGLTYVLGGILTGFAALYCLGAFLATAQFLLKKARPTPAGSQP